MDLSLVGSVVLVFFSSSPLSLLLRLLCPSNQQLLSHCRAKCILSEVQLGVFCALSNHHVDTDGFTDDCGLVGSYNFSSGHPCRWVAVCVQCRSVAYDTDYLVMLQVLVLVF